MTFEEFFLKKRINLAILSEKEPELFSEFRLHYDLMGPKSFDHTKKYWFNELRRKYPAPKIEKVIEKAKTENATAEIKEATMAKQGFKPMFKRPAPVAETTEKSPNKQVEQVDTPAENKPAAYQPKFKPSVTATKAEEKPADTGGEPSSGKPVYQPKFRSAMLPKKVEEKTDEAEEKAPDPESKPTATEIAKPAYKPRFKPAMLNQQTEPKPEDVTQEEAKTNTSELPAEKTAYKPRFKPAMPVKKEESPETAEHKTVEEISAAHSAEVEAKSEERNEELPAAKVTYKPRFRPPSKPQAE